MEIETKVISTEIIKPSSPTPKSLQKHQLSFLDQLAPPIFSHLVYFYSSSSSNSEIPNSQNSNHLKKSLSETLAKFYPLAGRLVDNLYVDCNDGGVPFAVAEANCLLSQVITDRDPKNTYKFSAHKFDESQGFCMAAQATYFRCGGVEVGICIHHQIADGLSFALFVKTWSAVARHGAAAAALPIPKFDAAAYFPPRDLAGFKLATGMVKDEALVTRTFTFPASKIAALRERYSAADGGRRPSRGEALSSFIWTRFVSATGMKPDPNKIFTVLHAVNLRPRANPPLSESHFGNIIVQSTAKVAALGDGGVELLRKVRAAKKTVDGGYVARLKEGEKHLNFMKEMMAQAGRGELVRFNFASLCGYPLYEADFGSGRPVWVGHGGFPFKNLAVFMDTKSGGGIEALIHLSEQDMEKFEAHSELQMLKSNL